MTNEEEIQLTPSAGVSICFLRPTSSGFLSSNLGGARKQQNKIYSKWNEHNRPMHNSKKKTNSIGFLISSNMWQTNISHCWWFVVWFCNFMRLNYIEKKIEQKMSIFMFNVWIATWIPYELTIGQMAWNRFFDSGILVFSIILFGQIWYREFLFFVFCFFWIEKERKWLI